MCVLVVEEVGMWILNIKQHVCVTENSSIRARSPEEEERRRNGSFPGKSQVHSWWICSLLPKMPHWDLLISASKLLCLKC